MTCCVSCRGLSIYSISKLGFDIVLVHELFIVFFILLGIQGSLNRPIWITWEEVTFPGFLGIGHST